MSETETESQPEPPAAPTGAKGSTEVVELSSLQQSTARALAESKAIAPHAYFSKEVDMRAAVGLLTEPVALVDLVVRAAPLELGAAERINAAYRDARFEIYSRINVAFSVAARDSLVLPVIHDADSKSLAEIAAESRGLEERARDGSITRPELAGSTFTVTAAQGVDRFTPVITRGQAATLGVGSVFEGVTASGGEVFVGPRLTLTLACDARIVASAAAADFLSSVAIRIQEPDGL
ncbi:hypothetical protein BH10ACT11_BH10ACT11_21420 [soil metagenome]